MSAVTGLFIGLGVIFLAVVSIVIHRSVKYKTIHIATSKDSCEFLVNRKAKEIVVLEEVRNGFTFYTISAKLDDEKLSQVLEVERNIDYTDRSVSLYTKLSKAKRHADAINEELSTVELPDREPKIVYSSRSSKLDLIDE